MDGNNLSIGDRVKSRISRTCTVKNVKKRFPFINWAPKYNLECLSGDIVAGLTVGLTVIPQGMAYAIVAGLSPNYGLYSSFMGCFIYVIFGSCKDITIGPTAIMAIMTHEYAPPGSADYAVLLSFISGLIILASGIINLGFLITFISKPVISGFTSAAAITIATSQLKSLFGLKYDAEGFLETIIQFFEHIKETKWQDITLGICCIVVLLLLRKLKDLPFVKIKETDTTGMKILKKCLFLFSVGRNAVIVIIAAIIAAIVYNPDVENDPFTITGDVESGLPAFEPPPFSTDNNGTYVPFSEMMSNIGIGAFVIPLISIIENIAIASAFSGGKTIDATQEMIALGLCNIAGSFVQSIPTTGSFSRTAVNSSSGVKTPAGGIFTGLLVVLALAVLTPYFKYIPKATLAAVIMCAVIFMVEYHDIIPIWKTRRIDQLPLWVTFITCLFWKLEYGILIGAGVNIAILLYGMARPKITETTFTVVDGNADYIVVEPRDGLMFPTIDFVKASVNKTAKKTGLGFKPIVVDCKHFTAIDYSGSKGIKALKTDFDSRKQPLIFSNVSPGVESGMVALTPDLQISQTQEQIPAIIKNYYETCAIQPTEIQSTAPTSSVSDVVQRKSLSDPESMNPLLEKDVNVVIVSAKTNQS